MIVVDKPKLKFLRTSASACKIAAYEAFKTPRRGAHRPGLGTEGTTSMQGQNTAGVDAAFGNWLAGFIDGEGCFTIRQGCGPRGESYVCEFHITLREDDQAIVREIASRTEVGRIFYTTPAPSTRNSKPQIRWVVSRRPELHRLIEILDVHPLRAKKARDYACWREAVFIWSNARWIWARMSELKQEIQEGRRFESMGRVSPVPPAAQQALQPQEELPL